MKLRDGKIQITPAEKENIEKQYHEMQMIQKKRKRMVDCSNIHW